MAFLPIVIHLFIIVIVRLFALQWYKFKLLVDAETKTSEAHGLFMDNDGIKKDCITGSCGTKNKKSKDGYCYL